jgi:glycosyltransferase involved in cell wall biosynthesis
MAVVFVNPTLQETQGLTNIEALACGTGVVTFHSGGSSECIDKSCGYVVERDDLNGLTSAIINACKAPFDRNACLQKARLYDKSSLYKNYVKLYEDSVNCLA